MAKTIWGGLLIFYLSVLRVALAADLGPGEESILALDKRLEDGQHEGNIFYADRVNVMTAPSVSITVALRYQGKKYIERTRIFYAHGVSKTFVLNENFQPRGSGLHVDAWPFNQTNGFEAKGSPAALSVGQEAHIKLNNSHYGSCRALRLVSAEECGYDFGMKVIELSCQEAMKSKEGFSYEEKRIFVIPQIVVSDGDLCPSLVRSDENRQVIDSKVELLRGAQ